MQLDKVKTDSGITVGFLTGTLNVTKYQLRIGGELNLLEMSATELNFVKQ